MVLPILLMLWPLSAFGAKRRSDSDFFLGRGTLYSKKLFIVFCHCLRHGYEGSQD